MTQADKQHGYPTGPGPAGVLRALGLALLAMFSAPVALNAAEMSRN